MERYIFFGAGEYALRLIGAIDPKEIHGFCDNYKAGKTIVGKPVYGIEELAFLSKTYIVVIAVEKPSAIQEICSQLQKMNIPYIHTAQLLLQKRIPYMELYPYFLRCLADAHGMKPLKILMKIDYSNEWEKEIENKYDKIVICIVTSGAIGNFCWVYGWFCSFVRKHQGSRICYCIGIEPQSLARKSRTANDYLFEKMKDNFSEVDDTNIYRWFVYLCFHIDAVKVFDYTTVSISEAQKMYRFHDTPCFLKEICKKTSNINFSDEENRNGLNKMKEMGIREKFVCFFSRDNLYYQQAYRREALTDIVYDICKTRNSNIQRYNLMATELKKLGIQSVRMGSCVQDAYTGEGIDYSNIDQCDFMDLYLFSRCLFLIGDMSGIHQIPIHIFQKPTVAIAPGYYHLFRGDVADHYDLILPYKTYDSIHNKFLTLKDLLNIAESVEYDLTRIYYYHVIHKLISYPVLDTEIWTAAEEMLHMLNGTQDYTEEDYFLHRKYCSIVSEYLDLDKNLEGGYGRLCAKWLRENQWYLE